MNLEGKGHSCASICSEGKQPVHLNVDNLVNVELSGILILIRNASHNARYLEGCYSVVFRSW